MNIPILDLNRQDDPLREEIEKVLSEVITKKAFILGPYVKAFEDAFASYLGRKACVGVSSGTSALLMAYQALGVKAGDEVITTPMTFIATAEPLLQLGAKPVFVDIDPKTYCIDPSLLASVITEKTVGIVPVHLYGYPAAMDKIMAFAKDHGLWVLEDAAQAHGAMYQGKKAGTFGDIATFSFYPGKNLGAYGDAGAVLMDDEKLEMPVRLGRDHGRRGKYKHEQWGYNERMDGFQGAVLEIKLKQLDAWNEGRRQAAKMYREALGDVEEIVLPPDGSDVEPVYHLYVVQFQDRDKVMEALRAKGIGCNIHYPFPLHLQPIFGFLGQGEGSFPVSEGLSSKILSLPMFPGLKREEIDCVAAEIKLVIGG